MAGRLLRLGRLPRLGPQGPARGGIILAAGVSRAEVERIASEDPFVLAGVCAYRITEFIATKTSPELAGVRENLAV